MRVRIERQFLGWKFPPAVMAELRAPQGGLALGEADARFLHGRWQARFELTVPEPGGGLVEVSADYLAYSVYATIPIHWGFSAAVGFYGTNISQSECGGLKVCDNRFIASVSWTF